MGPSDGFGGRSRRSDPLRHYDSLRRQLRGAPAGAPLNLPIALEPSNRPNGVSRAHPDPGLRQTSPRHGQTAQTVRID